MRSTLQSGWTLLLLTLTRVLSANGHGCALGETCVQVEQIDSTLWFKALARIIRQFCLKVNLYGVLVFNISLVCKMTRIHFNRSVAALDTSGERTNPGDLQTSAIMLRFHILHWCFLNQPSIADAVFFLPSHHPRASLATSAQGNCLQRSQLNGKKSSTASTTLSVLFSGLLMASPVPHQISSCSLSTSITADFNLTIRWGDKKMSHHT